MSKEPTGPLAWAWQQETEKTGEKFVLVALAYTCPRGSWSCFPGKKRLQRMTGMSKATIQSHLASLARQSLIAMAPRTRDNGQDTTHLFTLNPPIMGGQNLTPLPLQISGEGSEFDPPRGQNLTPIGGQNLTPNNTSYVPIEGLARERANLPLSISLWEEILPELEHDIPSGPMEAWIRPMVPLGIDGDTFVLQVPDDYSRKWFIHNFEEDIIRRLRVASGSPKLELAYDIAPESAEQDETDLA